jgi:hypothetical protein
MLQLCSDRQLLVPQPKGAAGGPEEHVEAVAQRLFWLHEAHKPSSKQRSTKKAKKFIKTHQRADFTEHQTRTSNRRSKLPEEATVEGAGCFPASSERKQLSDPSAKP